ncbi:MULTISPECIES: hypothetical protein [Marinomonas]|uniref:hypothetical protein n=1 Tax=Marinomonas TaxID=28253 RepID=UPI001055DD2C|nr:hypothetical protein [Marinomonas sp. KMM3893]
MTSAINLIYHKPDIAKNLGFNPQSHRQHSVKTLCKDKRFRKHRHGYVKLIVAPEQQRLFSDHTLCFAEEDYLLEPTKCAGEGVALVKSPT